MNKKIFVLFAAGLMVLSGMMISGAAKTDETQEQNLFRETISFTTPNQNSEREGYFSIDVAECSDNYDIAGNPSVSSYVHEKYLPPFVTGVKVNIQPSENAEVKTVTFQGKLEPSPVPIPKVEGKANLNVVDAESGAYYKGEAYRQDYATYRIAAGRYDGELKTKVISTITPVSNLQYNKMADTTTGTFISSFDVEISHDGIDIPIGTLDGEGTSKYYDLLILTPDMFVKQLQPLVQHKNQMGVQTKITTLDEIYDEYLEDAQDEAEAVKLYIKDQMIDCGIKYVILVGGLNSYINADDKDSACLGLKDWHFPVRYGNIWAEGLTGVHDPGMTIDWYFGCIYKYSELDQCWMFDSMDYDDQGVSDGYFITIGANPHGANADTVEDSLDPDIAVGRIPARNKIEVKIVVDKIINYERPSPKPWYKRCAWLGGDSFGGMEGEKANEMANSYMEPYGFEPIKLYASHQETGGLLPNSKGFISTVNSGVGFVEFEGHGNPYVWATYGKVEKHIDKIASYQDFPKLLNGRKLPVIIVGGCHNGQYNVTIMKTLFSMDLGTDYYYWTHGVPAPRGFSEWLLFKIGGGAILSTGCTGLGYGHQNGVGLNSEMEAFFFQEVGKNGVDIFGDAMIGAMNYWIAHGKQNTGDVPYKCLFEWTAFGDPSLKLGGY